MKYWCNENSYRRAELLSSAPLFKFDEGDQCTLSLRLAPRCLRWLLAFVLLFLILALAKHCRVDFLFGELGQIIIELFSLFENFLHRIYNCLLAHQSTHRGGGAPGRNAVMLNLLQRR